MTFEIKITACNPDDLRRQIKVLADTMGDAPAPVKMPAPSLAHFSMQEIVAFLATQGFTLAEPDAVPVDSVEEPPKKTRRKKAEAQPVAQEESVEEDGEIGASVSSPASQPEGEEIDLDTLKADTIDRLQELYFVEAGVPIVDAIRKRHAGKKKFSDLPKELFPQIAAELNEAMERANA